jgi:hypothetical protein
MTERGLLLTLIAGCLIFGALAASWLTSGDEPGHPWQLSELDPAPPTSPECEADSLVPLVFEIECPNQWPRLKYP